MNEQVPDRRREPDRRPEQPMPAPANTADPMVKPQSARPVATQQAGMWPEYDQYHERFHQVEMEFIEEPRAAVQKAEKLVQEAVERMTSGLRDQLQRMHGDVERESDTERLRQVMLNFRRFMDSMGGRRAA